MLINWRCNKYMANKKFLYGMGLGILGCNIYPLIKGKLRPIAISLVEGAIGAGSTTKSFMEEVNEKAMDRRKEGFKRVSENLEPNSLKSNDAGFENIESLKKQIEVLKNKIVGE